MNEIIAKTMTGLLCAGALASCLATFPVRPGVEITLFPPAWFIATSSPVYYEGRATYWYGDRWYYRDGSSWQYYRDEPAHLREYRGGHQSERKLYGEKHGGGFKRH